MAFYKERWRADGLLQCRTSETDGWHPLSIRQYSQRIARLEQALRLIREHATPLSPDDRSCMDTSWVKEFTTDMLEGNFEKWSM